MNTVELKKQRTALKLQRKTLVDALRERELDETEQTSFDELSDKIDALTSRIDALEKVENEDDPVDGDPEAPKGADDDDQQKDHSKNPKGKKGERQLDFPAGNIVTSKTRKDSHDYSVRRAMAMHTEGKLVNGLEGERSQEIAVKAGDQPKGFFMPHDFKVRGKHRLKRRDFTTSTGAGAVGITVESTFIELLRNRMVTDELGVTVTHSIVGKHARARQSGASTMYFIGEGSTTTPSNPTFDQVNFVPKTGAIQVNISRKSLFEMSIQAETAVEADLLKVLAIGLDTTVLAGNGSGANPTGIAFDGGVQVITLSNDTGNGADLIFMDALQFEALLAEANADQGSMAFVTTPAVRSKLKQTPKINSGQVYPEFVWAPDNTINGYPAKITNEMPNGITKGSSGATLNSIIFGNWEDAELALWGGIDIVVNPYINVSAGAIQYNLFQELDTQRMHSNSFVISTAVSTS
jgi:HK97 family phage major capsid protein